MILNNKIQNKLHVLYIIIKYYNLKSILNIQKNIIHFTNTNYQH